MEEILSRADVVVMNFGIHRMDSPANEYRRDMTTFLRIYDLTCRLCDGSRLPSTSTRKAASTIRGESVVWVSSTATTTLTMWRDMIVRETIEEPSVQIIFLDETTRGTAENSGEIFWLSVHDESRHNWVDLHKVHPNTGNCEATHVCQAPGL